MAKQSEPVRILCIGDSITQGGKRDQEEYTYRLPLQKLLREAGVNFDFIGSRTAGLHEDAKWPEVEGSAFDPHHEGFYGWKTAAVLADLKKSLPSTEPPDIALIHLGTNDQRSEDYSRDIVAPLREMIALLRSRNPSVAVVVGHLNFNGGAALEIRPLVEQMALEISTEISPVVTAHHYRGWKENPAAEGTDTFDWAHPNPSGQRKMAEKWFEAMKPFLHRERAAAGREDVSGLPPLPALTDADRSKFGVNVQRPMRLLEESTPERRNTVRVLFYGQSITEGTWAKQVADDLRARYPDANLVIENRAMGGFSSQRLVHNVETDVIPFQPDLLIFHVYGADGEYEEIVRMATELTPAAILIQTDHLAAGAGWEDEPTDPAKITRDVWHCFMNYVHLPRVAEKFGCGLLDQRELWKRFVRENGLQPKDLLLDGVHLNEAGNRLMAGLVNAYLVRTDEETPDPFDNEFIRTLVVGRDLRWEDGRIDFEFDGYRVDLIGVSAGGGPVEIRIDGKRPSEFAELYGRTRALPEPGGKWPALTQIGRKAMPVIEEWTLDARRDPSDEKRFLFELEGTVTGKDGKGRSDQEFVSDSGRVIIPAAGWDVEYAMKLSKVDSIPDAFKIRWAVVPQFLDEWKVGASSPGIENVGTVALGLPPGKHRLELHAARGAEGAGLEAVRVYSRRVR